MKQAYLKPVQACAMFENLAERLHLQTNDMANAVVIRLDTLTPGDFAATARPSRLD